jgi:pyruvate dehydrogenase phosphatase
VANAGDSRVVLGRLVKATGDAVAVQLSAEHNASIESVRKELHAMHPDDPSIVVLKHNVWRVKGLIQVLEGAGIRLFAISYTRKLSCFEYMTPKTLK